MTEAFIAAVFSFPIRRKLGTHQVLASVTKTLTPQTWPLRQPLNHELIGSLVDALLKFYQGRWAGRQVICAGMKLRTCGLMEQQFQRLWCHFYLLENLLPL